MEATTENTLAALNHHGGSACISGICWELDLPTNRANLRAVRATLRKLRDAGLVRIRQSGVQTIYSAR